MNNTFYRTREWRQLRVNAIRVLGNICGCCKTKITNRNKLHVDHVIPRSIDITLQLELTNLQVLCEYCNCNVKHTKSTDYRSVHQRQLLYEVSVHHKSITMYPTISQLLPTKNNRSKSHQAKLPKSSFDSHLDNTKIAHNIFRSMARLNNNRNDIQNVIARVKQKYPIKLVNKVVKQIIILLVYDQPKQKYSEYLVNGVNEIIKVRSQKTAVALLCDHTLLTTRLALDVGRLCDD